MQTEYEKHNVSYSGFGLILLFGVDTPLYHVEHKIDGCTNSRVEAQFRSLQLSSMEHLHYNAHTVSRARRLGLMTALDYRLLDSPKLP